MGLVVKCSLCGDIMECKKNDKQKLFLHIKEKHPDISLEPNQNETTNKDYDSSMFVSENIESKRNSGVNEKLELAEHTENIDENKEKIKIPAKPPRRLSKPRTKDSEILYQRKYKKVQPLKSSSLKGKHKVYKTTIEKWRPGQSKVTCPKCGETKTPVIKMKQDRVTKSPIGAAFILTCWPFCFLPYLFPPPTHEYLHCGACNHFLGTYDHRKDKINANNDFNVD